jgi:hypothetical protein
MEASLQAWQGSIISVKPTSTVPGGDIERVVVKKDSNGEGVEVIERGQKTFLFVMPAANVTVDAQFSGILSETAHKSISLTPFDNDGIPPGTTWTPMTAPPESDVSVVVSLPANVDYEETSRVTAVEYFDQSDSTWKTLTATDEILLDEESSEIKVDFIMPDAEVRIVLDIVFSIGFIMP